MSDIVLLLYSLFRSLVAHPEKALLLAKIPQLIYYRISGRKSVICQFSSPRKLTMALDLSSHMDKSIFLNGLFHIDIEQYLVEFLLKNLEKDSVFFDIGANSGYFSLLAATKNSRGTVHAFEPVPITYKNFQKSVQLNNMKNIVVNNICVGGKTGKLPFYVASHTDVSSARKTAYQESAVRIVSNMTTLPIYCKQKKIKRIDMIKIDTEGSEKDILFSSKTLLDKFKPILIVEFSTKTAQAFRYDPNEIYDFLIRLGYTMYSYKAGHLKKQDRKSFYEEDLYCLNNSKKSSIL